MNILIAMDSFKESLSSLQAGAAVAEGLCRVWPNAEIHLIPIADGGEGTVDALVYAAGGQIEVVEVADLLGRKRLCSYGVLPDGTAVIEVSSAAGLNLLQAEERDPLRTSTYGFGEMIIAAIRKGYRKLILCLGGSGTNDGGIGMLQALGFQFLDWEGNAVRSGAKGLKDVRSISFAHVLPELFDCEFEIACDVNNPLCGENGCSAIYGPQKGADAALVREMDQWMCHYAGIVKEELPCSDPDFPGAGAAGGLGFALMSFLKGKLRRGIDLVVSHCSLREKVACSDLVITGEGRIDCQTSMGKAPWGIAGIGKEFHKPVIALCGSLESHPGLHERMDACFSIVPSPCSLADALCSETAKKNLADTAEQTARLIYTFFKYDKSSALI